MTTLTRAETPAIARAAYTEQAAARRAEYAAGWLHKPNESAAAHFGVSLRTIGRWRRHLGRSRTYSRGPA